MSKIKDLVSKGVRLIVSEDETANVSPPAPPKEREIPAEDLAVEPPKPLERSEIQADVEDFAAVYEEAGVELPAHGYGIDKVSDMLENKRLATLAREVKASAVLAALEAASVPIRDVIQDAVRRDRALDAFEAAKEHELKELRAKSDSRVQAIREEIDAFLKEKNAEIESLKQATEAASLAFAKLQEKKRREEERLHAVVSHFIEGQENPITTKAAAPTAPAPTKSS